MAKALTQVFSSSLVTRLILGTLCLDLLVAGFAAYTLYASHGNYEKRAVVATQNLSMVLAQDLAASFGKIDLAIFAVKEEMERQLSAEKGDTAGRINAASLNA